MKEATDLSSEYTPRLEEKHQSRRDFLKISLFSIVGLLCYLIKNLDRAPIFNEVIKQYIFENYIKSRVIKEYNPHEMGIDAKFSYQRVCFDTERNVTGYVISPEVVKSNGKKIVCLPGFSVGGISDKGIWKGKIMGGMWDNADNGVIKIYNNLLQKGYEIVIVCYTGHYPTSSKEDIQSETKIVSYGHEEKLDLISVCEWLIKQQIRGENLNFFGYSGGGGMAMEAAKYFFEKGIIVNSIWADSALADMGEAFRTVWFGGVDMLFSFYRIISNLLKDKKYNYDPEEIKPIEAVRGISPRTRIFDIHCKTDPILFYTQALLYSRLGLNNMIVIIRELEDKIFGIHQTFRFIPREIYSQMLLKFIENKLTEEDIEKINQITPDFA